MKLCDRCKRPPSERTLYVVREFHDDNYLDVCPDPLHDLADRCEELLDIGKHQILRAEEAEAERDVLRADLAEAVALLRQPNAVKLRAFLAKHAEASDE